VFFLLLVLDPSFFDFIFHVFDLKFEHKLGVVDGVALWGDFVSFFELIQVLLFLGTHNGRNVKVVDSVYLFCRIYRHGLKLHRQVKFLLLLNAIGVIVNVCFSALDILNNAHRNITNLFAVKFTDSVQFPLVIESECSHLGNVYVLTHVALS
jgi:hypothetical protein